MNVTDVSAPEEGELLVVVGPTASGKTALAVELCERFGGEVVSCDSVQIYRAFDVGSGKPTADERRRAPHHLVDLLEPLAPMDAQRYTELADRAIEGVQRRGRTPIVCGGTFLWIKALVFGLARTPGADPVVRERHAEIARTQGRSALHAMLAAVDAEAARRLAPNDFVRVSRALEIYELTGRPQSEWYAEHGFRLARYRPRFLGAERQRDELDRRIVSRAEAWLEAGWIDEVRLLLERGYGEARAMVSVGYREVRAHVEDRLTREELAGAIVRSTRIFARRQRTWLRDQPVTWISGL